MCETKSDGESKSLPKAHSLNSYSYPEGCAQCMYVKQLVVRKKTAKSVRRVGVTLVRHPKEG